MENLKKNFTFWSLLELQKKNWNRIEVFKYKVILVVITQFY